MDRYHTPVLLDEVIDFLDVKQGNKYIDATLGGGGHTIEILRRGGKVLGIDVDEDAIDFVQNQIHNSEFRIQNENIRFVRGNFRDIDRIAKEQGFGQVLGILFDFGVSSFQLDRGEKGFSFLREGPLDMRMDQNLRVTAADLVQALSKPELQRLFWEYGEERNAGKIATAIVGRRKTEKIVTTQDLVGIIKDVYRLGNDEVSRKKLSAIAKRVFQALRIAVNDELRVIEQVLPKAVSLLDHGGRIVAISFHSLEDRIVKNTFSDLEKKGLGSILTKKPVVATDQEVKKNRRSRSAKLRVFEKGL